MAASSDPHRVLGIPPGASVDEIRRAYRRLAKEHHPDSAGDRALPRFLEIQAAYEQLVGGGARRRTPGAAPGPTRAPWQADAHRADATRRAYGSRSRAGGTGPAGSAGTGGAGTTGSAETAGSAGSAGGAGGGGSAGPAWGRPGTTDRERRRDRTRPPERPPNKATPGSTTYDGAEEEPHEPGWAGASWYGTTSGTYWTINPREYADPRKHGPEYQERARRSARRGAPPDEAEDVPPSRGPAAGSDSADRSGAAGPAASPGADDGGEQPGPSATFAGQPPDDAAPGDPRSWWSASGAAEPRIARSAPAGSTAAGDSRPPSATTTAAATTTDAGLPPEPPAVADRLVGYGGGLPLDRSSGPAARLLLAFVGGLPIALGVGWLLGELTGCSRFSARCEGGVETASLALGLVIVAVLGLVPRLGAIAATGTLALLVAAVPATVFLSATGGSRLPDESGAVLGAVLATSWIAGAGYGVLRAARSRRVGPPVS